jgi:hypothetical protein
MRLDVEICLIEPLASRLHCGLRALAFAFCLAFDALVILEEIQSGPAGLNQRPISRAAVETNCE